MAARLKMTRLRTKKIMERIVRASWWKGMVMKRRETIPVPIVVLNQEGEKFRTMRRQPRSCLGRGGSILVAFSLWEERWLCVIVEVVEGDRSMVFLAFVRRLLGELSWVGLCKKELAGAVKAGLLLASFSRSSESMVSVATINDGSRYACNHTAKQCIDS